MSRSSTKTKKWVNKQKKSGLCIVCTSPAKLGRVRCETHLMESSNKNSSKKRELSKNGWCRQCGTGTSVATGRTHCQSCLNKKKRTGQVNKKTVIEHYGGTCCWPRCGNTDMDVLTIDHIFDDGFKERTLSGERLSGNAFYHRVIKQKFPVNAFQVLCWNHQWKKRMMVLRNEPLPTDKS
jgi:hypothetical protein